MSGIAAIGSALGRNQQRTTSILLGSRERGLLRVYGQGRGKSMKVKDYLKIESATDISRSEVGRLGTAILFIVAVDDLHRRGLRSCRTALSADRGGGDRRLHGDEHRRQRRGQQRRPGGGLVRADTDRRDCHRRDFRGRRGDHRRRRRGLDREEGDHRSRRCGRPERLYLGDDGRADRRRALAQPGHLARARRCRRPTRSSAA